MGWLQKIGWRSLVGIFSLGLPGSGLGAQELTVNMAAEAGGDDVYLLFSQLSLARLGMRVQPVASVGGYLVFSGGTSTWGANPTAGLRYRTETGFIQGKLGWAFRDEVAVAYFGGSDNGFLTSLEAEFLGDAYNATGVLSFNWGGDYLWGHALVGRRVAELAEGGSLGLGAELIYQSQSEDAAALLEGSSATQIGPVLQWTPGAARPTFSLSGGWKRAELGLAGPNTWYVRAGLSLR